MFSLLPFPQRWGSRSVSVWLQVTCCHQPWHDSGSPTAHALSLVGQAPAWPASPLQLNFLLSFLAVPGALNCTPEALPSCTVNELVQTAQGCGASPARSCLALLCWGSRAEQSVLWAGCVWVGCVGVWNSCWSPELAPSPLQSWNRQFLLTLRAGASLTCEGFLGWALRANFAATYSLELAKSSISGCLMVLHSLLTTTE